MKELHAVVFGSTGLVGSHLIKQLVSDNSYKKIYVVNRTPQEYRSKKIKQIITDFEDLTALQKVFNEVEICFYCIGTTIGKAKSQERFREIEYGLTIKVAEVAKEAGLIHFLYVSSIGANYNSSNFYLRTKGEIELALQQKGFERLSIMHPSMLLGKRNEFRPGEKVGKFFAILFYPIMFLGFSNYQPIHASRVANAMRRIAKRAKKSDIYSSDQLKKIAKDKYQFS